MANKKRSFFSAIVGLKNLFFVLPSVFSVAQQIFSISLQESKQAIKSLVVILILAFIVVALALTTWLTLLAIFYIYLTSIAWTPLAAMGLILLINVIVLSIFVVIILEAKRKLTFPDTRKQLQLVKKIYTD